jgi:hypothetical protein
VEPLSVLVETPASGETRRAELDRIRAFAS